MIQEKNKIFRPCVFITAIMVICGTVCVNGETAKPAIEMGPPFCDNAILQRQMNVPVWGWSDPGTKSTVEFAGQKKSAKAGKDGKWMLKLAPLKASFDPSEMVITDSKGNKVVLDNILVGEVWLASGQSNMQWIANKCNVGRVLQKQIAERVAAGKEKKPVIREGKVTNRFSALQPIEHADAEWSTDTGSFSAISYAFAYKLFSELNVPIGIVNCAFSTTKIQAWIPREGFAAGDDEYTKAIYKEILQTDPRTKEHKQAWSKYYQKLRDNLKENNRRVQKGLPAKPLPDKKPGNLNGNRDACWMYNARINPVAPYAIRGGIWNQGYASQGEGLYYYNNLHSLVRGWRKVWNKPDMPVYFHQFYSAGKRKGDSENHPDIGSTAEMRLGTWLARDIPNADMASQIDITGSIHYYNKTIPGFRLALHALKNQYGKDITANGPMFKSYSVSGNKLIVEFDHAGGGLLVAETGSNSKGIATPSVIENGDDKVELFYIAGPDRVWHKADVKIDGEKVILTAPGVKTPKGVSYAAGGVGTQPNLYNKALLPMTPFIYYDHKLVTSKNWPDKPIKIAGYEPETSKFSKEYEYRKMPLLSTQFRDNAVLQAEQPVTIWGSAVHDWGYEADGDAVIKFSFDNIKKTIPVKPGMSRWQVTLDPMQASSEPKTLKVTFEIDGELVHQRIAENIVIGDVFYVSSPFVKLDLEDVKNPGSIVRVMKRQAKRCMFRNPSPYSVCVSTTPKNRFASYWADAKDDLAGAIGRRIAAKTNRPVGIIFMQGENSVKDEDGKRRNVPLELKHWIRYDYLKHAPSLMEDYQQLASIYPGNRYYNANVKKYIQKWKDYWNGYITEMIETKAVPDGAPWGTYPTLSSSVTTDASQAFNVMTNSFGPASLKGIIFLCSQNMFEGDKAASFGPQLSALANSWKNHFTDDPCFIYTIPAKNLAGSIKAPKSIKGCSKPVEINNWKDTAAVQKLIDKAVN